ncbi:cytochrome C oxidase assembly protein [Sulfitobacter sp. F26169L]|uniref:cytochrome C oxidase assembly protein n=1 Tax=Sulfitobacter sp. F26169L TaxID=2996015 RepID=UPI002260D425|nr:cytochrome C oxidase assembly protein [Sulfitobacter sp. F26169L]MCX7567612.1 cytochrome C oxidase assembly protein [Sulfitobacter sp. F26169L]
MSLRPEHELHSRRKSLNIGVGILLGAFVLLVMVLTFTKITSTDFRIPASQANGVGEQQNTGGTD